MDPFEDFAEFSPEASQLRESLNAIDLLIAARRYLDLDQDDHRATRLFQELAKPRWAHSLQRLTPDGLESLLRSCQVSNAPRDTVVALAAELRLLPVIWKMQQQHLSLLPSQMREAAWLIEFEGYPVSSALRVAVPGVNLANLPPLAPIEIEALIGVWMRAVPDLRFQEQEAFAKSMVLQGLSARDAFTRMVRREAPSTVSQVFSLKPIPSMTSVSPSQWPTQSPMYVRGGFFKWGRFR
jgi:hypothetical protein